MPEVENLTHEEVILNLKSELADAESYVNGVKAELTKAESAEVVDKEDVKAIKAKLRTANSAFKAVERAIKKENTAEEKRILKAEKLEAKQEALDMKAAEKAAKLKAKEEAKAAKEAAKIANQMPIQNGIRHPKPATLCARAWAIADNMSSALGSPVPIKELLVETTAAGLNAGNVKTEYSRWRKFHGISGRIVSKQEATAETTTETTASETA